jgi:hypothetical protein
MEEGDGGGSGGAAGGGGGAGGGAGGQGGVYDDGLDDLWPPAHVSSEHFLAQMWEDDPATNSTRTSSHVDGGDG